MTTPFMMRFAEAVVDRLVAEKLAEITPGGRAAVVTFVAAFLATSAQGGSLISGLEAALLSCPEVVELYADVDRLKQLVDELG